MELLLKKLLFWSDILLLLHIEKEGRAGDILFSPPDIDIQKIGSNWINAIIIFTIYTLHIITIISSSILVAHLT